MPFDLADTQDDFERFVRDNTASLLVTAHLLSGNAASAEDLVQDTLTRLYPKWGRVIGADVPIAYVRRSLINGFLNTRRGQAGRERPTDALPEQPTTVDFAAAVSDRDQVWRLLTTLPDRQRAAVVLRFFHDLSDEAAAKILGCRVGTVRSLISRGLTTLRGHAAQAGVAAAMQEVTDA